MIKKILIYFSLAFVLSTKIEASQKAREFPLNPSISPCENFYQYVCSSEIEKFQMPENRSRYTFFYADAYENFIQKSEEFFNNLNSKEILSARSKQIRDFNASCLNKESRVEEEKKIVEQTVKDIVNLQTRSEVLQYFREQLKLRRFYLFYLYGAPHTNDPKKWRLEISIEALTLPNKSYYQKTEVVKALSDVLQIFFTTLKVKDSEEHARRLISLEDKIAQVAFSVEELDNRWDVADYWSQEEFIKKFPLIADQVGLPIAVGKWPVHQYTPKLYEAIEKILAEEDINSLKSLLLFHLLRYEMNLAYPEFESAFWSFRNQYLGGPAQRRSLSEECLVLTQDYLGRVVAKELTDKLFKSFPRKSFIRMVEKVKSSFLKGIRQSSWLRAKGHRQAIKKVKAIDLALLYPDREKDWRLPPLVKLSEKEFLENIYKINRSYDVRTIQELKSERNLKAWSITPLHFDASFYRAENRFYFPAAFAMKPIYDSSLTERENLAGIGFMIGHELGHALDKFGSLYDEMGKKNPIFSTEEQKKFDAFADRFIKQFNEIGHNGTQTLSENLADHIGLISAFEAAFPGKKSGTLQERKDYFIRFARSWCTAITESKRQLHLKEDPHALPEARVNEQLKHLSSFVETFQCSESSKMFLQNKDRIRIW